MYQYAIVLIAAVLFMSVELSLSSRHRFSVYDCLLFVGGFRKPRVAKPSIVIFVILQYACTHIATCTFACALYIPFFVLFTFLFHKYQVFGLKIVSDGPGCLCRGFWCEWWAV